MSCRFCQRILNRRFLSALDRVTRQEYPVAASLTFSVQPLQVQNCQRRTFSERELLVKGDPDTFGDVADDVSLLDEEEDKKEKVAAVPRLRTKQYADKIKEFIAQGKIKEAIDYVEVKMIEEDMVKPENYIFNLLLGACGRVGYTKKAFSIYNKMKQRGLKITPGSYTALFNACANSPWITDGLGRAKKLRDIMIEKGVEANNTTYHAMIKAFGRCGDYKTAFALVDEMKDKRVRIDGATLNFLLQACITNKENGLLLAALVWKKFGANRVKPDIYSFNLLLRATKECGIGSGDITEKLNAPQEIKLLQMGQDSDNAHEIQLQNVDQNEVTSSTKLALFGGMRKFLSMMKEHECPPNVKTFTLLLDCISQEEEAEFLQILEEHKVKLDVVFFNMLLKKNMLRTNYDKSREILEKMVKFSVKPDIFTYGILALGCKTIEDCDNFLAKMKQSGCRPNTEILGSMLGQACYHNDFKYVLKLMELCINEGIKPNRHFLTTLEEFKGKCYLRENCKDGFLRGFEIFKMRYKTWLTEVEKEEVEHPWQQFRQETTTDTRKYRPRDADSRFKPIRASKFVWSFKKKSKK